MEKIVTVKELLEYNLNIPDYQRPYKWTNKNIADLLDDINNAINNERIYKNYKYRLGTIILHNKDGVQNIVDGQQRIISLLLLNIFLNKANSFPILEKCTFTDKISISNIKKNYEFIKDYLQSKGDEYKNKVADAMSGLLEVVVITVEEQTEAFQLFDSQNTRGKALDPHDLLKAYHLREMKDYPYKMRHAVNKWESVQPDEIRNLFSAFLFPVHKWSIREKTVPFTAKEIDVYKGIPISSPYSYAKRAAKAAPCFQLTQPFIAGNDFFEMVSHYLQLYRNIEHKIEKSGDFRKIYDILKNPYKKSTGFDYAKGLFYCALFCYYDKFRNFDERAVIKIFIWALMIRVDMRNLGFDSINNYALGNENDHYTNCIPMFYMIKNARMHNEIANLQVSIAKPKAENGWDELYNALYELNHGGASDNVQN